MRSFCCGAFRCLLLAVLGVLLVLVALTFDLKAVLCFVLMLAAAVGYLSFCKKRESRPQSGRELAAVLLVSLLLLAVQIFVCVKYASVPLKGDLEAVYTGAKELVIYGKLTDSNPYFLHYPHQLFTCFFYAAINRLFVYLGASAPMSLLPSCIVNCALTTAGSILLFLAVRRAYSPRAAVFAYALFWFQPVYFTANTMLYPHSLLAFFISLSLYLFSRAAGEGRARHFLLACALCGIGAAAAQSVESIFTIGSVAFIIWLLIAKKPKRAIAGAAVFAASLAAALLVVNLSFSCLGIIDKTNARDEEFPKLHWVMIGLTEHGVYSEDDYQATVNLPTREAKLENCKAQIKARFESRTAGELLSLAAEKEQRDWAGDCYGAVLFNASWERALIHAHRALLLALSLAAAALGVKRYKLRGGFRFFDFLGLWLVGLFLFFAIWESYTSYLVSSVPALIFAACGIFERERQPGEDISSP